MELAGRKLGLNPTTVGDIAQATQEGKSAENVNMFTQIMKTLSSIVGPREGEFNTGTGVQPEGMHPHQKELLLQRRMEEAREEAQQRELKSGITDLLYRGNTGLESIRGDTGLESINKINPVAPYYNDLRKKYSGEGWGP